MLINQTVHSFNNYSSSSASLQVDLHTLDVVIWASSFAFTVLHSVVDIMDIIVIVAD